MDIFWKIFKLWINSLWIILENVQIMDKRTMDKLFGNLNLWINAIWVISGDMKNYDGSIFIK